MPADPEFGAAAGAVLVVIFFALVAGSSGLFSAKGIVNFLEVSAQLGILASAVALLMIAGEFDLSIGSMIGLAGMMLAIPALYWGWPMWVAALFTFALCATTIIPFSAGMNSVIYLVCAVILDVAMLVFATQFLMDRSRSTARRLFFASILFLPLLLGAMLFTKA